MATTLNIRCDEDYKMKVSKAAALQGIPSISEYIKGLVEQDADKVIARATTLTLKGDVFDRFMDAIESPPAPNEALLQAKARAEELGIE